VALGVTIPQISLPPNEKQVVEADRLDRLNVSRETFVLLNNAKSPPFEVKGTPTLMVLGDRSF
jgi:hypothetical protein